MIGNIVYNQQKNIRQIQNMVLSQLFENKDLNFTLEINPEYLASWSQAIWSSQPIILHKGVQGVIIPSELCFLISYLDLLTVCSGGLNSFSENISQNLVKIEDIAAVVKRRDLHPLIKSNVIYFFYEVYLETERENYFHFQKILSSILDLLVDDFMYYLDNPVEKKLSEIVVVTHDQCETNEYYHNECILRIIDCFENIIKKNIQVNSSSAGFENLKKFILKGTRYCNIYQNHQNVEIRSRLYELKNCINENTSQEIHRAVELSQKKRMEVINGGQGGEGGVGDIFASDSTQKLILQSILHKTRLKRSRRISEKLKVTNYRANDAVANKIEK